MTQKAKAPANTQAETETTQSAQMLHDDQLDSVSGGPIYVKVDGVTSTSSISDGTSNIKDGLSHIVK